MIKFKNTSLALMTFVLFIFTISFGQIASASKALDNLKTAASIASYSQSQTNENTVADVVGRIASIVLAFVGITFFCFILYSGYQWLTAGGKEESITAAKTRIVQSTIGLSITALAYFLTWFFSQVIIGQ